jgi:uncharacterized protein involved in outer membrane biogenesis
MKILKILGAIFLVLIVLISSLPFVFKGKIVELVNQQIDETLSAEVSVGDIDFSLISTFPDFGLSIQDIKVVGKEEFAGVQLANIGEIKANLDVMSVISGEQIDIKSFGISDASFHVIVTKDSLANYDIVKSSGTEEEVEEEETGSEEASAFSLSVNEYYLRNINVIYDDRVSDMYAEIVNFTHEGKGDFTQDIVALATTTTIDELTFQNGRHALSEKGAI